MHIYNNDKEQTIVLDYINTKRTSQQIDPVFNNQSSDSDNQNSFDSFPAKSVATSNSSPQNQTPPNSTHDSSIQNSEQVISQNLSDSFPESSVAPSDSSIQNPMVNDSLSDSFPEPSVTSSTQNSHQDFQHDSNYLPNHINNTETPNQFDPFPAKSVAPQKSNDNSQSNMISIAELIGDDDDNNTNNY